MNDEQQLDYMIGNNEDEHYNKDNDTNIIDIDINDGAEDAEISTAEALTDLGLKRRQLKESVIDPLPKVLAMSSTVNKAVGCTNAEEAAHDEDTSSPCRVNIQNSDGKANDKNRGMHSSKPGSDFTPPLYKIKKTATQLKFSESSQSFLSDDESFVHNRTPKNKQKRVPFTEEEKGAIRDGMKEFGLQYKKWELIKSNYSILKCRNATSIKVSGAVNLLCM